MFGFFTTVVFAVGALIAASDLFMARAPSGKLSVGNVQVYVFSRVILIPPLASLSLF